MVTLSAGNPATTVSLPNPDLADTEGLNVEVNYREAMNGKPFVYSKRTTKRNVTLTWSELGRGKLVEVAEFFKAFIGNQVTILDHNGVTWLSILDQDSITIETQSRAYPINEGRGESGAVSLTFIGSKLSG
jgi:hypothetical protein